jgi:dihydropteroate synthase-like protein
MRKKILFITGKEVEKGLREILRKEKIYGKVHVVSNVDVASFLTPEIILKELSPMNLVEIEKIIVPGTVKGNLSVIEKKLKVPCFKGPKCFLDLPRVLKSNVHLSEKISGDEILNLDRKERIKKELKRVYEETRGASMKIGFGGGAVFLGAGISRVIAEIIDAPKLSNEELRKISSYYQGEGAEIIDIGMVHDENHSKKIPKIIETIKSEVDVPLSIDTLNEKEILAAIKAGIDLIISLDFSNYEDIAPKIADVPDVPAVVIIPRDEKGKIPEKAEDRIRVVRDLMKKLKEDMGVEKMIVDLILQPINFGFSESLKSFIMFREKYPKIPMMMGLGNITELMDVDSIGLNGLLAGIASELNIDLLLTTEASEKTKGCIGELSTATKLMYLSKKYKQTPKDLGIDLLVLKEKKKKEWIPKINKKIPIILVEERKTSLERDIEFRIFLNKEKINAIYYNKNKKPILWFQGTSAEKIYKEILSRGIIKNLAHAAYLGKELAKAEIALKLGREYIQDEPLFS